MCIRQSQLVMCAGVSLALLFTGPALAQGSGGVHNNQHLRFTQQHGLTFSEIGDPGNPGFLFDPPGPSPERVIGSVDYRYGITTREVTHAEYLVFLNAFAPHIDATGVSPNSSQASTKGISFVGRDGNGVPSFLLPAANANKPAEMGWRFAARFANWMHHGAPTGSDVPAWVFETGAYNTSTFITNPDGSRNDQASRSVDARFWIPTQDEWNKAAFWDPNHSGDDEGGYWMYPNASDERLTPGFPDEGGQTNFGMDQQTLPGLPEEVGSYPNEQSPWGLVDLSGGVQEWTESLLAGAEVNRYRHVAGPGMHRTETLLLYGDHIGWNINQFSWPESPIAGFRLAMAIPSPGAFLWLTFLSGPLMKRKRRLSLRTG